MKEKLLTRRQQLGIFNCADPVALMREYVSYSHDIMVAAVYKDVRMSYKRDPTNKAMLARLEAINLSEKQKECIENLSSADISEIYGNEGNVYPEVFLKMLDVFPKEISLEILRQYVKDCNIRNDVRIKALQVLGKDAKEIILPRMHLTKELFNEILRTFSLEGAKQILIEFPKGQDCHLEGYEVEEKILKIFSDEDLRDILRAFVGVLPWMSDKCFLKIFDIFSPDEVEELLWKAIRRDMDLWRPTLRKIVDYFPKKKAKALINAFGLTSPGKNCYTFERQKISMLLKQKK